MDYMILDTNVYMSLCLKRAESVTAPCIENLRNLLEMNRIKIVLPEIVKIEFQRCIEPEFKKSQTFLKEIINQIDKIVLPHDTKKGKISWRETDEQKKAIKEHLRKILSKFEGMDVQAQIQPIMEIMKHKNTELISTTEKLLFRAFKRVVEKRAPAHNVNKRSEADCLIVESIISYFSNFIKKENIKGFFITDNKRDFADPNDQYCLHPHLRPTFEELNIFYKPILTKLLKEEFDLKIDEEDIKYEEEIISIARSRLTPLHGFWGPTYNKLSNIGEEDSLLTPFQNFGFRYTDQSPSWNWDNGEGM